MVREPYTIGGSELLPILALVLLGLGLGFLLLTGRINGWPYVVAAGLLLGTDAGSVLDYLSTNGWFNYIALGFSPTNLSIQNAGVLVIVGAGAVLLWGITIGAIPRRPRGPGRR